MAMTVVLPIAVDIVVSPLPGLFASSSAELAAGGESVVVIDGGSVEVVSCSSVVLGGVDILEPGWCAV